MTKLRCVFCALAAATLFFLSAAGARAGDLQLSIANGRVTLIADNVTLRTILSEWARIGQTKIVNAEKLAGTPVTLKLIDVSERQALDTLLRSAAGYMAAPRAAATPGASHYDRIMILASSRPTVTGPAPSPAGGLPGSQRFQTPPPMMHQQPTIEPDSDDEEPSDEAAPPPAPVMTQPGYMPNPATAVPSPVIPGQPQPGQVTAPVMTSPRPGQLPPPQQPPPGQRPIP